MAVITSKATGNWSDGSTWDSDPVIPANGDTVTIANTHTVTLNADLITGAIDLAGLTIDNGGTLQCSTATGTYSILCSADITVNGTFSGLTTSTLFWSSTPVTGNEETHSYAMSLGHYKYGVDVTSNNKVAGYSIRCVKD